jgi:hypothetical protein
MPKNILCMGLFFRKAAVRRAASIGSTQRIVLAALDAVKVGAFKPDERCAEVAEM